MSWQIILLGVKKEKKEGEREIYKNMEGIQVLI